jgi:type I restriction enzyme S subunit
MNGWKECKLGDVAEIIDCEHKTAPIVEYSNYHSVRTANISNGRIDFESCNRVSKTVYDDWTKRKQPIAGDIVLAREAPVGEVGYISTNKNVCLGQRTVLISANDQIDSKYLLYYLCNPNVRNDLISRSTGSVVEHLNVEDIKDFQLAICPNKNEQRSIADVLSSLDDKVDLLHRQNKTLEGMAVALWRKMFVEDAKEAWEEVSLLELINLIGGGTPKTDVIEYWAGKIPWISAKDITANHKGFITETEKNITEMGLNCSSTKLLPKYSTIITARGTVGNYCMLASPMAFSQTNYGILPIFDECYFFTYLLIAYVVDELKAAAYGSIFDTITTNTFNEQKFRVATMDHVREFENNIKPYFEKILYNSFQIHMLYHLRDTLLPQLMSGVVRVIRESEEE